MATFSPTFLLDLRDSPEFEKHGAFEVHTPEEYNKGSFYNVTKEKWMLQVPVLKGIIDRRILINYQIDPAILAKILPPPFQPKLIHGIGVAGICLIRLKAIRPSWIPSQFGFRSENAAHRIAVQWQKNGQTHEGVYIPRRDTSSFWNTFVGGRLFPGIHHRAHFRVQETQGKFQIELESKDHQTHLAIKAHETRQLPKKSVFQTLAEASDFFEKGSLGYSDTTHVKKYDGLELKSFNWKVTPLRVEYARSSFFDNRQMFPKESIHFDHALLMRNIVHEWHQREVLVC